MSNSTVKELAKIARDLLSWTRGEESLVLPDVLRKIELVCKAVIEYDMLLNG